MKGETHGGDVNDILIDFDIVCMFSLIFVKITFSCVLPPPSIPTLSGAMSMKV